MAILCHLGLHKWDGCKCSKCRECRDAEHKWNKDGCLCLKCSKEKHEFNPGNCKCPKCGLVKHDFHQLNNYQCRRCGKIRDGVSIESLLALMDDHSDPGDKRNIVIKKTALAAAKAILSIGGYKHANILIKMIERDPPDVQGNIFAHLAKAIEYKFNGYDFQVHYTKRDGDEQLYIYRWNNLPD